MKSISTKAIITSITSKVDGSLGLRVATPELRPEQKTVFFELQNLNLELLIKPLDEANIEEVKIDTDLETKTHSQRLRSVLYVLWEKDKRGLEWDAYYRVRMEKIIELLKKQIDE